MAYLVILVLFVVSYEVLLYKKFLHHHIVDRWQGFSEALEELCLCL